MLVSKLLQHALPICLQEEGVEFFIDGSLYNFKGTLSLVPADNLASQFWVDTKL